MQGFFVAAYFFKNSLGKRIFFAASIGSISDWLPSRRSVASQIGAWLITWSGQVRSGRRTGGKGRYLDKDESCMAGKRETGF